MSEGITQDDMLKLASKHIVFARSGYSLAIYVKVEGEFVDEILEMEDIITRGVYDYYVKLDMYLQGEKGRCLDNEMTIDYARLGGYLQVTKEKPTGYSDEVFTLPINVRRNT